jgi:hypothetical protein
VRPLISTARAVISGLLPSMQCSYPSVDTGNAQSMYLPAGIALEKLLELAGIEIFALTVEFDRQLLDEVISYKADPLAG